MAYFTYVRISNEELKVRYNLVTFGYVWLKAVHKSPTSDESIIILQYLVKLAIRKEPIRNDRGRSKTMINLRGDVPFLRQPSMCSERGT